MDSSEDDVKQAFKNLNIDIEKYCEEKRILFLDLFTESQNTLINKETLTALVYDHNKVMEKIIPFLERIKSGFIVLDTASTLMLNSNTNVYSFIRAIKMLAKSYDLVVIDQLCTSAIDETKAEAVLTNADYVFSVKNNVLFFDNQKIAVPNKQALHLLRDSKGRISIQPSCNAADFKPLVLNLFSKSNLIEVKPVSTLDVTPQNNIPPEILLNALKALESEGQIESIASSTSICCPKCNSYKIKMNLTCSECENHILQKNIIIEHLNCRHSDFQSNFEKDEKLVCPKCNKDLKQIGVDYAKVGSGYQCANKHIFSVPEIKFECLACKEKFGIEDGNLEIQKFYSLNPDKVESTRESPLEFVCLPEGLFPKKKI